MVLETKDILSNTEPDLKNNVVYKKACIVTKLPLEICVDISITGDNKSRPKKCNQEFTKANILWQHFLWRNCTSFPSDYKLANTFARKIFQTICKCNSIVSQSPNILKVLMVFSS